MCDAPSETLPAALLRLFGWSALIALLFAGMGVGLAIGAGKKAAHMRDAGATAEAVVVALTENHRRSGRHSLSHSYEVTYRFQAGSSTYTATGSLPRDQFLALEEGDRLPVRYWTTDPSESEIDFGDAQSDSWVGVVMAAAGSVATLVLGRLASREASEAAWMARHARRHAAEITGHVRTSIRINGFPLWRAEWRNADGTTGTSACRFSAALPRVGTTVTVVTDPEGRRPGRLQSDICI
ncbi:MAG: DUF3592 domain-containing protein [Tabrizicola sp.]